ncbi:hypothetical protein [Salinimicrobium xinjiangense]|uniref:hypothetical protein n=1 Tax=Salinimicrobium xinjiangense TaxID=438596 RepID=UPI0004077CFB|nr:hypothetical protein [Salinimicrobium xinjiangense]
MKNLKLLLVGFTIILSSAVKAETFKTPDSVSVEIERMLTDIKVCDNKDVEVTVFFSISEDQKIQNLSVASSNREVGEYIQNRLENRRLPADWMKGKIYELTVIKKVG